MVASMLLATTGLLTGSTSHQIVVKKLILTSPLASSHVRLTGLKTTNFNLNQQVDLMSNTISSDQDDLTFLFCL
jgi:hypothetical protein